MELIDDDEHIITQTQPMMKLKWYEISIDSEFVETHLRKYCKFHLDPTIEKFNELIGGDPVIEEEEDKTE
jgi:hypothetical protein